MAQSYVLPGRLGDPNMSLETDPRTNPQLLAYLTTMGLQSPLNAEIVGPDLSAIEPVMAATHAANMALIDMMKDDLPGDELEPEVRRTALTIEGVDGNAIALHVFRRADIPATEPLPTVVYIHGGGMTVIDTDNHASMRWCRSLALEGVMAVAVDFRNAWTASQHNPFPAGLNDCATAVQYLAAHRTSLGIRSLIVEGESGGGNLTLATALKAKRESWISAIAGVFAVVPFVSNAYGLSAEEHLATLPSLRECDGYFVPVPAMADMARYYAPNDGDATNPLAWPLHASLDDLKGLPPHHLSMDELDPLRDEGVAYYRKLVAAGVPATAEVNLGMAHAAGVMLRPGAREAHKKVASQVAAFAKRF